MQTGHSVLLHCLQLEELASKAFPKGSKRLLTLVQQVFNTVPEEFRLQLKGLYVSAPNDDGPWFEWEDILTQAAAYDKQHWKSKPPVNRRRGRNRWTANASDASSGSIPSSGSSASSGASTHTFKQRTRCFWNTDLQRR